MFLVAAVILHLTILDEHGKPTTARVMVRDVQGNAQAVKLIEPKQEATLIHPNYPAMGVVVEREAKISLPVGKSTIIVARGTEYRRAEISVEAAEGDTIERSVRMERWVDMAARGWWSGETHVHRAADEMTALMMAADLHCAPTITRWNNNSNLAEWPKDPIFPVGKDRAYSVDNAEDERQWGAALFLGLKTPMPLYRYETHWPPPTATWEEARRRGAFVDQEKVMWWQSPMIAALVRPDTIGVAVNQFMEDETWATEAWGRPRDQKKYTGPRGWADYMFDLYYNYLNVGFRVPASAGSANGVLRNPLGYNRSYVYLGKTFSFAAWLDGQRAGRNFVTNGPMLFFTVSDKPAGTVFPDKTTCVTVKLDARSTGELEKVELILDGQVVQHFAPSKDPSRITASARLDVRAGGWLVARCFEKNDKTVRFAHTSPVYFGDKPARSPEALQFFRDWIDADMERIGKLPPAKLTAAQRDEILSLCRQARAFYEYPHAK